MLEFFLRLWLIYFMTQKLSVQKKTMYSENKVFKKNSLFLVSDCIFIDFQSYAEKFFLGNTLLLRYIDFFRYRQFLCHKIYQPQTKKKFPHKKKLYQKKPIQCLECLCSGGPFLWGPRTWGVGAAPLWGSYMIIIKLT